MLPVNTASQERTRAISGTWYLGLIQVLGTGASYLLLAALTRMGPEQYGLWVLVLLLAGYLSPWAGLGLSSALIRHMPAYADRAEYLGDTDFVDVPLAGITSKGYAEELRSQIRKAEKKARKKERKERRRAEKKRKKEEAAKKMLKQLKSNEEQ